MNERPGIETKHLAQLQQLVEFIQETLGWEVDGVEVSRYVPSDASEVEGEAWKPTRFGWTISASPSEATPIEKQKAYNES